MSHIDAGWSSLAARRAHNPKVVGSNPAPATNHIHARILYLRLGPLALFLWLKSMHSKLNDIIEPAILALNFDFVGLEWVSDGSGNVLRVYVDSDQGVTVENCAVLSRQIGSVLEVEDAIKQSYRLEVSSPGLNRPLFKLEHFKAVVGKTIKCRLRAAVSDRKNFKGTLVAVEADSLLLAVDGQEWTIRYSDIDKANLVFDY